MRLGSDGFIVLGGADVGLYVMKTFAFYCVEGRDLLVGL